MVITEKNIEKVLNNVIKQLDKAGAILNSPSCSSDKVGQIRNKAYMVINKAYEDVRNIIHNGIQ